MRVKIATNQTCTRVADRALPQIKVSWRQPGDFGRSSSKMFRFSTHEDALPSHTRFFTTRMLVTAAALIATSLATFFATSLHQLGFTVVSGWLLAISLAAFYGTTSKLPLRGKLLLAVTYGTCFFTFVSCLALVAFTKIDLEVFNQSGVWSPLPADIIAGPIMVMSLLLACFFAFAALKLSNIVALRLNS